MIIHISWDFVIDLGLSILSKSAEAQFKTQ